MSISVCERLHWVDTYVPWIGDEKGRDEECCSRSLLPTAIVERKRLRATLKMKQIKYFISWKVILMQKLQKVHGKIELKDECILRQKNFFFIYPFSMVFINKPYIFYQKIVHQSKCIFLDLCQGSSWSVFTCQSFKAPNAATPEKRSGWGALWVQGKHGERNSRRVESGLLKYCWPPGSTWKNSEYENRISGGFS